MSVSSKAFRQICDKPCANEIKEMKWSPKNDLIAVLTLDGEVRVHRLNWGKVWNYGEKGSKSTVLAWSPDGKVLAIGSENCLVKLVEVEKCNCMHSYDVDDPVTSLQWVAGNKGSMSVLIAGTKNGCIKLFVNGTFQIASIRDNASSTSKKYPVRSLSMSKNLKMIFSVHTMEVDGVDKGEKYFKFRSFDLLSSRLEEIKTLTKKYETTSSLLEKFDNELKQVSDSWQNILQKVSSKLDNFSEMLPADTSVSDEFLMAFACGTLSAELQSFLINELTMKGLRKLGVDVNSSYANIKSHVVDNLQSLCYDLSKVLSEVLGMGRWYEKYGILGLCEKMVQDASRYLGSFMLKIRELLCVIDRDLKSFRAFFKWVSGVMYRISDEPIPTIFKEFSQEEYAHILAFLQTQLVKKDGNDSFILEKVGQYVKEGNLDTKEDQSSNPWYAFVEASRSLRENPLLILPEDSTSLLDMAKELHKKVGEIFERVKLTMTESLSSKEGPRMEKDIYVHEDTCTARYSWSSGDLDDEISLCFLPCVCASSDFYLITIDGRNVAMQMQKFSFDLPKISLQDRSISGITVIRDVSFYDTDYITVLLVESEGDDPSPVQVLAQVDISSLAEFPFFECGKFFKQDTLSADISKSITKWRFIDSFDPLIMSVSGTRKVSCLLANNRRRVRIFDMDAEDEEEEDPDDYDEYDDEMEDE